MPEDHNDVDPSGSKEERTERSADYDAEYAEKDRRGEFGFNCADCGEEIHAPGGICRNCETIRTWQEEIIDHGVFGKHPFVFKTRPNRGCCKYARECFCVCERSYHCPVHGRTCEGSHD